MKPYITFSDIREDLTADILAEIAVIRNHYKHLVIGSYEINLGYQNN
jgi:hypothetical protein